MSEYLGERYVPQVEGEWNVSNPYDRLSIVTVTTGENVDGYISRMPVPVGTPITNNQYWALMYISRITSGGSASVSWVDITNKPDFFPPEAHTQGWETITGKPTTFTPAAHTQNISTINGLSTTITDLQEQIDAIAPGGGGAQISCTQLWRTGAISPPQGQFTVVFTQQADNRSASQPAYWDISNANGFIYLKTLDGSTDTYDIFMSGNMYVNAGSTTGARVYAAIHNTTAYSSAAMYTESDMYTLVVPETYMGSVVANSTATADRFYMRGSVRSGDAVGSNLRDDFTCTIKAIRRG